jgi:hypothetical protein
MSFAIDMLNCYVILLLILISREILILGRYTRIINFVISYNFNHRCNSLRETVKT